MKHFIACSGLHGCMSSDCEAFPTYKDAVEYLVGMYGLGRKRAKELREDSCLELNLKRDGNEYCEITECDCSTPWEHSETDSE
jgi:hypothetical protein